MSGHKQLGWMRKAFTEGHPSLGLQRKAWDLWAREEWEMRMRETVSWVTNNRTDSRFLSRTKHHAKHFVCITSHWSFSPRREVDSGVLMSVSQPVLGGCPGLWHLLISVVNTPTMACFRLPVWWQLTSWWNSRKLKNWLWRAAVSTPPEIGIVPFHRCRGWSARSK